MKIVYARAGTSTYDKMFADFLALNHRVDLVTVDAPTSQIYLAMKSTAHQIKVYGGDWRRYWRRPIPWVLAQDSFGLTTICRQIVRLAPDVVVSGWIPTYGFYVAMSGFHPHVLLIWGSDVLLHPQRSRLCLLKTLFTLRKADMVVVDSDVQKEAAIRYGCDPRKILCFPWAVDLNRFSPRHALSERSGEDRRTVLCTRIHESIYGIEYLLEAIPLVVDKIPATRFVFAGSGSLTDRYREFVSKHCLDENVEFLGLVPHEKMPRILVSCDVYVTPSLSDGSSATLLEAMACAKPCVASDIPGNREWINDGVNGILVAPRDPQSLAEAVIRLLKEPETAGRLGRQARATVEQKADLRKNLDFFESRLIELVERVRSPKKKADD